MIRTWKCLLGAWAVCAFVCQSGYSQDIVIDEFGTARVQPGPATPRPADVLYSGAEPIWTADFQPPPGVGVDPLTVPDDSGVGYAVTNDAAEILYRIQRTNRHMLGLQDDGYTSAGAFIPLQMYDGGNMLIAVDPRAFVSDSGAGGMNIGFTARRYSPRLQRVLVFSQWFDYDRTGQAGYAQYGLHAATLGKFWSLRGNINLPVGQSHEFYNRAFTGLQYQGNNLVLTNNGKVETAYQRFDAEFSFPLPYFARYGFEFGVGAYYLNGAFEGVQDSPGASARFEAQVTEDLWANALMTQDDVFGSNLSLNFELTLPNAPPSRMMRRLPIKQYMVQSDKRMYRVARGIENRPESELATSTNPDFGPGSPILIAHIDPNATGAGDGTFESPFSSVQQYESLADADQDNFELVLVAGRTDGSDTNLNTTVTLFNGQRLLGSGVDHFIVADQGTFLLPEFGTTTPFLTNSGADTLDVIRLANRNEVSGFLIDASSTARGINGLNGVAGISGFNINRNTIQNTTVGAELAVSGNDDGFFSENVVTDATAEGVILGIDGGNFDMPLGITDNEIEGNGTDGFVIRNVGGGSAVIEGIVDNSFDNNGEAGLLIDGSGTLAALPLTLDLGLVANNTFNRDASGTIGFELDTENTTVAAIFSGNDFTGDVTANTDTNRGLGGRVGGTGGVDFTFLGNNTFTNNADAHIGLVMDDDTVNSIVIEGTEFVGAVDGSSSLFDGEGVSLLVRQRSSLEGGITSSLFEDNAGTGLNININGNSFPAFARLLAFDIGGPNVADGNIFRNNGTNIAEDAGLAIIRTGNGQVGTNSAILVQNNLFEENTGSGFHFDAAGTPLFTDRYTVLNNRSINNEDSGALFGVRADAQMNVDMDQNLFDGNLTDGIHVIEQANSAADQRGLSGTWTRNEITDNGRHGIGIDGRTDGLTIGDLLDDDLFNFIDGNTNDGISITASGGLTIGRNLISENGSNTTGAGDNDAGIDIHSATAWSGFIFGNTIINNNGDGIELESDGPFPVFVDITNNFIAFNDGRGFDVLAQPSDVHDSFTDIDFHDNIVNENGEEGVYVIATASHDQTQDGPSTNPDGTPLTMNANGHINSAVDIVQLRFDMTGNQVLGNGQLSDLVATGLVVRIGTSGEGSLFGAPFDTGDFVSDGVSVDSAFQNSGVIMRVADNQFGGNFGDDVYFDSFTSTETPLDTAGTWSETEFTIDDARGDPLARLDLHWSNNTYDSTNVTNVGAFYDNAETTFKSRDVDQTPPGPFGTGAAQPRRRNAQRLAARLPNVLNPTTPISSPNWLYPGMGPSSFRIRGNQIQITNDGFILDDGTSLTYNNTNDANGVIYAVPNSQMPYGWGYIGP